MKASEIRDRSTAELVALEKDLSRQLWKAKFDNHTNQLDDTAKNGRLRRDVARVKTVLSERARQASLEGES